MFIFDWINRYRVRYINPDVALYGLLGIIGLIIVVFLVKWMTKSDQKY